MIVIFWRIKKNQKSKKAAAAVRPYDFFMYKMVWVDKMIIIKRLFLGVG